MRYGKWSVDTTAYAERFKPSKIKQVKAALDEANLPRQPTTGDTLAQSPLSAENDDSAGVDLVIFDYEAIRLVTLTSIMQFRT